MLLKILLADIWEPVFTDPVNDFDTGSVSRNSFVPEQWAQEALMILQSNMVAANLVYRDYSPTIAQYGEVVNTHRPAAFTAARKHDEDDVTVQAAKSETVPVKLDQHLHTTFLIRDGQETRGFVNLRETFLKPAVQSIAQAVDRIILGQVYDFWPRMVGSLKTAMTKTKIISARELLTQQKAPLDGRNLIITPKLEGDLLTLDDFSHADKYGDNGTALHEGSLGRVLGFNVFTSQNAPSITPDSTRLNTSLLINNAAGYPAGTVTMTTDGISGGTALTAGMWVSIAGDATPQLVLSTSGGTTPISITVTPGLKYAVADNAIITMIYPTTINDASGYAAGFVVDADRTGLTVNTWGSTLLSPRDMQMVSFGATAALNHRYSSFGVNTATETRLNRGLDLVVAQSAAIFQGPPGDFGWAFHPNAVALVTRPLAAAAPGSGALSYVAEYGGVGIRVTIAYDPRAQGHLVTVDLLCGVKTLDRELGCIVLG